MVIPNNNREEDPDAISYHVAIELKDSIEVAPNYGTDVKALKLNTAIVVGRGTKNGKATVDLQIVDGMGQAFVVMTTGAIIKGLAKAIEGHEQRLHAEDVFDEDAGDHIH